MAAVSKKKISFTYIPGDTPCQKDTRWDGCCCECAYHSMAYKHCWHSPRSKGKCVCSESLGFYLCTVFVNYEGNSQDRAQLSGEHGYCEMFKKAKPKKGKK